MSRVVTARSLLLAGALTAGLAAFASQGHAQSLGEVAKQNKTKNSKTTTKRVFTDDDVSHATQPVDSSPKSSYVSPTDIESTYSTLAEKSPRQLGEAIVPEIKFPERSQWEQKLYEQKEKMVAAGRAYLAAVKSGAGDKVASQAKQNVELEIYRYNNLKLDGWA